MRIVVSTCTKNAHLLPTFWECFDRAWPNCPYDMYVLYNWRLHTREWYEQLGPHSDSSDLGWSDNLYRWLEKENAMAWKTVGFWTPRPVLLLLEDYFMVDVDEALIIRAYELFRNEEAGCMRLLPCPGPEIPFQGSKDFGIFEDSGPYRVSLQASIWSPDCLQRLLEPEESAWGFEVNGTKRRKNVPYQFYGTTRNAMSYQNYLRHDKPQQPVVEWLEKEGFTVP